jgi:hypothetical protein
MRSPSLDCFALLAMTDGAFVSRQTLDWTGEHEGIALDQPPITYAKTVPQGRKATKL